MQSSDVFSLLDKFLIWRVPETKAYPLPAEVNQSCVPCRNSVSLPIKNSQRVLWNTKDYREGQRQRSSLFRQEEKSQWSSRDMHTAVRDIKQAMAKLSEETPQGELSDSQSESEESPGTCRNRRLIRRVSVSLNPGKPGPTEEYTELYISEPEENPGTCRVRRPTRSVSCTSPGKPGPTEEYTESDDCSLVIHPLKFLKAGYETPKRNDAEVNELKTTIAHLEIVLGILKERLRRKTNQS